MLIVGKNGEENWYIKTILHFLQKKMTKQAGAELSQAQDS